MLAERAAAVLGPYANADACWRLLVWALASNPVGGLLILDRRAIARSPTIGLTEDQIRGAIDRLVACALLDRQTSRGEGGFQRDANGKLVRDAKGKPIRNVVRYRFSAAVEECFAVRSPARRKSRVFKSPTAKPSVSKISFRGFEGCEEGLPSSVPQPLGGKGLPGKGRKLGFAVDRDRAAAMARLQELASEPKPVFLSAPLRAGRFAPSYQR